MLNQFSFIILHDNDHLFANNHNGLRILHNLEHINSFEMSQRVTDH